MKKEMNLKEIMVAHANLSHAREDVWRYYRNLLTNGYVSWQDRFDQAVQSEQAALEQFSAAVLPLEGAIAEAQKGCRVRTIDADDILSALEQIEERLGIGKTAMDGITVSVDINGDTFPGSYKGIPESTVFHARYESGSWSITDIRRERTRGTTNGYQVVLTDAAKTAIIKRMECWG